MARTWFHIAEDIGTADSSSTVILGQEDPAAVRCIYIYIQQQSYRQYIEQTLLLLDRLMSCLVFSLFDIGNFLVVQSRYSFYSFHSAIHVILLLLAGLTGWFQFCFTTELMTFGQAINGGFPRLPSILHTVEKSLLLDIVHIDCISLCRDSQ